MRLVSIFLCCLLSACSFRVGNTPARSLAKSAVAGKGTPGQCLPFANALHAKFQAAGIQSRVVTMQTADGLKTAAHAFVLFDDNGRRYVMDNMTWQPIWVSANGSNLDVARQSVGWDISQDRSPESMPLGEVPRDVAMDVFSAR